MTKEFAMNVWDRFVNNLELAEKFSIRDEIPQYFKDANRIKKALPLVYHIRKEDEILLDDALIGAETGGEMNGFVEGIMYASYLLKNIIQE